jgi:hypothetical protein
LCLPEMVCFTLLRIRITTFAAWQRVTVVVP